MPRTDARQEPTARPYVDEPPTSLVALLGRTRAAILVAVADRSGSTTSELAASLAIGTSNVSQQATVLREAGLVATDRHRNTALHTPTATGRVLITVGGRGGGDGGSTPPPAPAARDRSVRGR
ncbi:winged helix-turn-helix domain-containing protein [Streptomyces sp. H27-D2]|nr:winged helix-turn-helix domain-containing protein [Streptomyces sp. H27-D2]